MAASTHINDGGTWRRAREIHINDGGTWRKIKSAWVNDSGVWRKVFSGLEVALLGSGVGAYDAAGGTANITFANTGVFTGSNASGSQTTPYNWLVSGDAADAEIFIHQDSGAATTGATKDVWLSLATSRTVSLAWPGGGGSASATLQIQLRDASSGIVLAGPTQHVLATHP